MTVNELSVLKGHKTLKGMTIEPHTESCPSMLGPVSYTGNGGGELLGYKQAPPPPSALRVSV